MNDAPIPDSYWVVPGRLLVGAHPGVGGAEQRNEKHERLRAAGVTMLVDLTEEGEYGVAPHAGVVRGLRVTRRAVRDLGCPSPAAMNEILDLIDAELANGEVVFVHCHGGAGRTGTVVGCYLVRHGRSGEEALEEIKRLRERLPSPSRSSPETDEQRSMVLEWPEG